ncbi:hypothetical protein Tco_0974737 [Tanacetum coccineum]|uniref:Uncharacterized protein n=1 Tax=Tanacetum coccineum TaxID=301880 RepID=A0ABQ5ECF1_9ASTR
MGKHGHEKRKSTKEARDAKPKAGKVKKSKLWSTLGTDISKITRKPSKTGKHGHEERKSTKEASDAKPKAGKVKKSKLWSALGQLVFIGSLKLSSHVDVEKAQGVMDFALEALTKLAQAITSKE